MSRIIWRRRGVEWVGRLTAGGPDRFAIRRDERDSWWWKMTDLQKQRCGFYQLLRDAKAAAETFK